MCMPFTSSEATASGGIGAPIALGSHVFVAPEFRLGWEPRAAHCGDNRDCVMEGEVRTISACRGNSTMDGGRDDGEGRVVDVL